jgi:hypothetical protein
MLSNRLLINADVYDRTDVFQTQRRQHQLPVVDICVGGREILPVSSARNLGVYFDSGLCMRRHIDVIDHRAALCSRCCVNCMRTFRRFKSPSIMQILMTSFVLPRLVYTLQLHPLRSSSIRYETVTNCTEYCRPNACMVLNIRRTAKTRDRLADTSALAGFKWQSVSGSRWRSWHIVSIKHGLTLSHLQCFSIFTPQT